MGDGFSVAWRTLDAQYWGVPQRRKRIYLVADFAGGRAGEILFERDGLRGHPAAGEASGKGAAADAPGSTGRSCGARYLNCVYALQGNGIDRADTAGCNGRGWRENICYTLNTIDRPAICFKAGQGAKARSIEASETVTPTLGSEAGGNSVPAVCYPRVFHSLTASNARNVESAQRPNCICYPQIARTLTAEADASPCIDRGQNVVCYDTTQITSPQNYSNPKNGDPCHPLAAQQHPPLVVYDARGNGDGAHCPTLTGDHENRVMDYTAVTVYHSPKIGEYAADGTASTMAARDFKSPRDLVVERSKPPRRYIIRRLMPLESCRLQGFPDGWGVPDHKDKLSDEELAFWQGVRDTCAAIGGKPPKKYSAESLTKWYNGLHTDSAENKMWGNGIALPCAAFVLERIKIEGRNANDHPVQHPRR